MVAAPAIIKLAPIMKISTRFQPIYVPKAWALSDLPVAELRRHADSSMRYLGLAQLKVEGMPVAFDQEEIPDWLCEINELPRYRDWRDPEIEALEARVGSWRNDEDWHEVVDDA